MAAKVLTFLRDLQCDFHFDLFFSFSFPIIFYRAAECRHGQAMRILSVCLSVKCVHCDKMEEKSVQIFIPYENENTI